MIYDYYCDLSHVELDWIYRWLKYIELLVFDEDLCIGDYNSSAILSEILIFNLLN